MFVSQILTWYRLSGAALSAAAVILIANLLKTNAHLEKLWSVVCLRMYEWISMY
jgi:hypothetical protein